jgi:Ser/Thr protein kinase RdoA (MazF antagonist)
MADLHQFSPDNTPVPLLPAHDAIVWPATYRRMIDARLAAAARYRPALNAVVNRLLDKLLSRDAEELPRLSWRLTPGDFGPQNMLFTTDDALTVLDFESAGWDDPAHAVMSFVAHATAEELPPELTAAFLAEFARLVRLPLAEKARYELVGRMLDLEWVAMYASALSDGNIVNKRSAVADFSQDAHVGSVLAKMDQRLTRAIDGHGYHFPS